MAEAPAAVGLAHGHELHVAHVHMGGQVPRPPHGFGDVFRGQGIQVFVSGFRSLQVALETHGQKFGVQMAWLDVGHADGSAQKVAAEHPAEVVHESLGGTVHVAALECAVASDGADVDDVAGAAFYHAGQDAAGAVQQSVDVGGDHFVPVVHVARLSGVLADGAARVVQQHVDVLEPFGKVGEHFHHDVTLGDVEHRRVLPEYNREVILSIRHFIVENVRTARRFLKKTEPSIVIDDLVFYELNKHTSAEAVAAYLAPLAEGESVGVISEAGCPAVADPGADVVAIAQRKGYKVVPLVGPSSILMSVMGSGFNGQSFAFHGYLPIDASQRTNAIKKLEGRIYSENQTQLFIETPYRNNKLAEELIRTCRPSTKLCIASNITCEDEYIHTRPVKEWAGKVPDLSKKPTIFLIYK